MHDHSFRYLLLEGTAGIWPSTIVHSDTKMLTIPCPFMSFISKYQQSSCISQSSIIPVTISLSVLSNLGPVTTVPSKNFGTVSIINFLSIELVIHCSAYRQFQISSSGLCIRVILPKHLTKGD